ncbi:major royal jelly protein 1-like [Colletes gigas]|uniref:major royal jelly protein 1-like n=1 Tax=Colletes gigas TaxID=935657 RepID=UPI001C9B4469|nr:major royal jelly protein 1-like [Colletes gigas]XP_043248994.1 major royal jelly protein 1-like [Colletes gigas]XP_043248995.1 major royal jelly protein 1-like [Colletes gigas]
MTAPWLLALCFGAILFAKENGAASETVENRPIDVTMEWKFYDYVFENYTQREEAIKSGNYNRSKCFPIDVDVWSDKMFITIIRDEGVPSSLNIVSKMKGPGGPLLQPYPSWEWAKTDCTGITSVYRVSIDECNRLWVLDTGVIGTKRICPAQLLCFDLRSSKLLKKIQIPENIAVNSTTGKGLLVTPIAQTPDDDCSRTLVYMADVEGYALIVYDGEMLRRITSDKLLYDPEETTYTIEGESFELQDGPVGMAVSPITNRLYLSPMSSRNLLFTYTWPFVMRRRHEDISFREKMNFLPAQSSAKAVSRKGVLFMGLIGETAIVCWCEDKVLKTSNLVTISRNSRTLQGITGLKVKYGKLHSSDVLFALTNRYQKIAAGTMNFNEINFRVLKQYVDILVNNTACMPTPKKWG